MAIQNANLMDIALKIGGYLKNNEHIKEFVAEQFQNELQVRVGEMLHVQLPTVEDTPYIVLYDWRKREGTHIEFCVYSCNIAIGVGKGARPEFIVDDNGVAFLDAYDVSHQFAQLIINELNNRDDKNRPLAVVETKGAFPIEPDGSHWVITLECSWRVYQTMGFNTEEF